MKITKRQKQICKYLSLGYTNPQIAEKLKLTPAYVQNLLGNLYQVTDTKNKHHLVSWAYRNGVLSR